MKQENPTTDLSLFGYRELQMAIELLKAFKEVKTEIDFLGDGIKLMMNTSSGNVFLTDDDFNVAMMNGEKIQQWLTCSNCGKEDFKEELTLNDNGLCEDCTSKDNGQY
jgi:hypothetical protein